MASIVAAVFFSSVVILVGLLALAERQARRKAEKSRKFWRREAREMLRRWRDMSKTAAKLAGERDAALARATTAETGHKNALASAATWSEMRKEAEGERDSAKAQHSALAQRCEALEQRLQQASAAHQHFIALPCPNCGSPLRDHNWIAVPEGSTPVPSCRRAKA